MSTWESTLGSCRNVSRGSIATHSRDFIYIGARQALPERHENLEMERKAAIRAAKELFYGEDVIEKLLTAKSVNELTRVLHTARTEMGSA